MNETIIGEFSKTIKKFIAKYNEKLEKNQSVMLDDKVNQFIDWYAKNNADGYTDIGEYHAPRDLRNLIDKMAVWYEFRYPDYEINRLMPGSSCDSIKINDVMFKDNQYFNGLLDENSDARYLDWDEFYNTHTFFSALPWKEKWIFSKPIYPSIIYLNAIVFNDDVFDLRLHLNKNGIVNEAESMQLFSSSFSRKFIKNKELEGLNIRQVIQLLNERGIELHKNNLLYKSIEAADKHIYQKEEMLNCVMYRIIERGGNRIGPRRAFLFAKEFNRNIDIPMIYGVDRSDPGLEFFVNMYLEAGGSKQLSCLINYFNRTSDYVNFETITIDELIKQRHIKTSAELKEEELAKEKQAELKRQRMELLQKLALNLYSQIDQSELKKALNEMENEQVKQLRLERKLGKSRKN